MPAPPSGVSEVRSRVFATRHQSSQRSRALPIATRKRGSSSSRWPSQTALVSTLWFPAAALVVTPPQSQTCFGVPSRFFDCAPGGSSLAGLWQLHVLHLG